MSKHLFEQFKSGKRFCVEVGYDRALNEIFLNIKEFISEKLIYTSLSESSSIPKDFEWLGRTLAKQGIVLPTYVAQHLVCERMFGGSNATDHHPEYVVTELEKELLRLGFRQLFLEDSFPIPEKSLWLKGLESADDEIRVVNSPLFQVVFSVDAFVNTADIVSTSAEMTETDMCALMKRFLV